MQKNTIWRYGRGWAAVELARNASALEKCFLNQSPELDASVQVDYFLTALFAIWARKSFSC